MILGIGIDLLETRRMKDKGSDERFLKRFLHPDELADAQKSQEDPALIFASRFAAKEAFGKALGIGLRGLSLRDIAVTHDALGRPELTLYGTAGKALARIGGDAVHLSITHQESMVAAVVIIEGKKLDG